MVFALAQTTGWPEDCILWEIPLSRALQYWHAWLYGNGIWTVPKALPVQQTAAKLADFVRQLDAEESDDE